MRKYANDMVGNFARAREDNWGASRERSSKVVFGHQRGLRTARAQHLVAL